MSFLMAVDPVVPILVGVIMALWSVAGWLRIHRLARYYQDCLYDTKRYSRHLLRLRRERREVINALANLLSTLLLGLIASRGHFSVPGIAVALALYSGFLALIDIAVRPPGHHRGYTDYVAIPRTLQLMRAAYVIDAIPLIVYVLVLTLGLVLGWDMHLIGYWGAATGPFTLLLTPIALPLASLLPLKPLKPDLVREIS
jgi:hypothetical protein